MTGIVPDGYISLSEALALITEATKTAGADDAEYQSENMIERAKRILNHMLKFPPTERPIVMVDNAGNSVQLPTDAWGEPVLGTSDLDRPGLKIFVHGLGFAEALENDAQRRGMDWPLRAVKPYISFADLIDLFEQNEELSSLGLPTEIRRRAMEGELEVDGRRPTGGSLQRIPLLDFVDAAIDPNWPTRKASVAGAYGPIWVDLTFRRENAKEVWPNLAWPASTSAKVSTENAGPSVAIEAPAPEIDPSATEAVSERKPEGRKRRSPKKEMASRALEDLYGEPDKWPSPSKAVLDQINEHHTVRRGDKPGSIGRDTLRRVINERK
jgi:hypothetical protein